MLRRTDRYGATSEQKHLVRVCCFKREEREHHLDQAWPPETGNRWTCYQRTAVLDLTHCWLQFRRGGERRDRTLEFFIR